MVFPVLDDYTIAWICALPSEAAAARVMLDRAHPLPRGFSDPNAYEFGEIHGHYIVIAYLPNGLYGTTSAAAVASRMALTFPRLRYGLMVGIGGGVPGKNNDIRLGDVVVSNPGGSYGGVIQYDFGKTVQDGRFVQTGTLNQPPHVILSQLSQVKAKQMTSESNAMSEIVSEVLDRYPSMRENFSPPEETKDFLFNSSYGHPDKETDCAKCDKRQLVKRQPRDTRAPCVHYGLIASGNQVMKDSRTRDRLAKEYGILCFEMEAAGLMNMLPTLVIRGICDYCDSHKQKQWQGYAALTAAAFAKVLLSVLPVQVATTTQLRHGRLSIRALTHG
jgi:nucleoside phosphorylase